jgi:hypothetical protein
MSQQSNATQIPLSGSAILAAADLFSRELEKVTAEKKSLEERIFWAEEKEASFARLVTERNKAYADERKAREENTTLKAELEAAKREADYLRTVLSAVQIEIVPNEQAGN